MCDVFHIWLTQKICLKAACRAGGGESKSVKFPSGCGIHKCDEKVDTPRRALFGKRKI